MKRIAIMGAGGMGAALGVVLAEVIESVTLWARDPDHAAACSRDRENVRRLPGVRLPESLEVTADWSKAAAEAELIVIAVPSAYLRAMLIKNAASIAPNTPIVSTVKGIDAETFERPSGMIAQVLGDRPIYVLSGPSHAEEFARGLPASVVLGGEENSLGVRIRDVFNQKRFRVYLNPDQTGVELGGALKNTLGIAAGICEGLGLGDNAKAALLTRGLVEMSRFACELGARASTISGLAGLGDLITTCYSPYGRNRALGVRIGRGATLEQALAESHGVAEGVPTTKSVHALATKMSIEMPITRELYCVLFEGKSPLCALSDLMNRLPKLEWS